MPLSFVRGPAIIAVVGSVALSCGGDVTAPARRPLVPAAQFSVGMIPPRPSPKYDAERRLHPRWWPTRFDSLHTLQFATYDGSGQVIHPDVAASPTPWPGRRWFMAITPYPNGNTSFENPSVYSSADGLAWSPPPGVVNPVVRPESRGYLSDPSLLYNPDDGRLWMYYREATPPLQSPPAYVAQNIIRVVTSPDGMRWSNPEPVVTVDAHALVSPTVVRRAAGEWYMWSVDGGTAGCGDAQAHLDLRRSSDGVHWSPPTRAQITLPGRHLPWHIAAQWVPSRHEFWMLSALKVPGSCATPAVYLSSSRDGVSWIHYPTPVLRRGAIPEFHDIVYRSAFQYDAKQDVLTLYYSGARASEGALVWSAAVQRRRRSELFAEIRRQPAALTSVVRGLPMPEIDP